ncbi:MAG: DUF3098 domain-containing protein [Chitinophagaceae bacterium]|nr:DUF3098 domain-containing protein [Chitinophagaceae bacterium]
MEKNNTSLFSKDNYVWMVIGIAVMLIGFLLMAGGKSQDPTVFDNNQVYSFQRITLAPILILTGLMIEVYAIMKKSKS